MKFNSRDLFWLTAVVALVLGWIIDHATAWVSYENKLVEADRRVTILENFAMGMEGRLINWGPPDWELRFKNEDGVVVPPRMKEWLPRGHFVPPTCGKAKWTH